MEPLVHAFMSDKYPDVVKRTAFIANVRKEMENRNYRLYSPMYLNYFRTRSEFRHIVIGRKPETKDQPASEKD